MSESGHERRLPLFHGTSPLEAIGIDVEGFRLPPVGERFWGRGALGDGIYLTGSLEWAREFARDFEGAGRAVVIGVELAPGTRLVWLDGEYDRNRIDSLRREFGAGILREDFHRALPPSKHLRARELIDLLNFLHAHADEPAAMWRRGWAGISGVRTQLRRAKYAGFGCATDDLGVVVFDPSALSPANMVRFGEDGASITVTPSWLLDQAATQLRQLRLDYRELSADTAREWSEPGEEDAARLRLEEARRQMLAFAQRHGLAVNVLLGDSDAAESPRPTDR